VWQAHGFEAWSCEFAKESRDVLYTGGDDCLFRSWDARIGFDAPVTSSRAHPMGVCAIRGTADGTLVATGCYDENLRLWDPRALRRPLKEIPLGGGVWRIKWHPTRAAIALCACMHGAFVVVDTDKGEILATYGEHPEGDLAYGADWGPVVAAVGGQGSGDADSGAGIIVATSTFAHSGSVHLSVFGG
jgi:diphthamide biosynthesis protein 7